MKDVTAVTPNDPDEMKSALAVGPIAILLSTTASYTQYKGGIISGLAGSPICGEVPNHYALSVGWGTDATAGDFYIVKESFGSTWGESGYSRIAITQGKGTCGIN